MPKYTASYTVVKSFETQVVFEAPNDDVAAVMASDMAQNDSSFIADRKRFDRITPSVTVEMGGRVSQSLPVDRNVQRWCENRGE